MTCKVKAGDALRGLLAQRPHESRRTGWDHLERGSTERKARVLDRTLRHSNTLKASRRWAGRAWWRVTFMICIKTLPFQDREDAIIVKGISHQNQIYKHGCILPCPAQHCESYKGEYNSLLIFITAVYTCKYMIVYKTFWSISVSFNGLQCVGVRCYYPLFLIWERFHDSPLFSLQIRRAAEMRIEPLVPVSSHPAVLSANANSLILPLN